MAEQLQGALTFALVCMTFGAVVGFWLGRASANHRLQEENRVLMEQRLALEKFANEQDGGSVWVVFLIVFMAGLMVIWIL